MTLPLRRAAAEPRAGRKARMLARLLHEGLPVLDGLVVLPDEPATDLALDALGPGPYVVRSSSPLEDRQSASAAGLYLSLVGVAARDVPAAIARVRASAHGEAVTAYLTARGEAPAPIAALVQPDVGEAVLGIARSSSDGFFVEERPANVPESGDATASHLSRASSDPLVALLDRTERLLGGAVDVEYARTSRGIVLLQARPVVRAQRPTFSTALPPGRWRLDAEHNPDPISAAQAGLVMLVDGPRFGPRARVIGGYLYVREDAARTEVGAKDALARFHAVDGPALRAELAAADGAPLEHALDTYVRVVRRYARTVRPSLGGARRALDEILLRELGESLWDHPRLLRGVGGTTTDRDAALYALGRAPDEAALRAYVAKFGMYAPAWDVAVPCDDEDRARLLASAARRALGPSPEALGQAARSLADAAADAIARRLPSAARFAATLAHLRQLIELGESDDRLFFEGQRLVRRALLVRGRAFVLAGMLGAVDEIFDLPLTATIAPADSLPTLAEAGATARREARRAVPPYRIVDRVPSVRLPASTEVLHGRGVGGQGRGRAHVVTSLTAPLDDVPEGAVLVVPAALPSLAPLLPRLAGLVTEHGGALSHAATLAREIGLPAVVGVAGASAISPGTQLYVDGERGRVLLLSGPFANEPAEGSA